QRAARVGLPDRRGRKDLPLAGDQPAFPGQPRDLLPGLPAHGAEGDRPSGDLVPARSGPPGDVAAPHARRVLACRLRVPGEGRGWLAASTAVVVLAVLSDPLTAVLLPIALVFAIRARDARGWLLPGCIAAGLVAQIALRDQGTSSFGGHDYSVLPRLFAERVTSSVLVGDRYLKDVFGGMTGSPFAW